MKDMKSVMKSKYVAVTLLVMPLFMALLLAFSIYPDIYLNDSNMQDQGVSFLANIPLTDNWDTYSEVQQFWFAMMQMMVGTFLIVPVILPSVIAADSFAGERERKTISSLSAAPISDEELYVGKILSSIIPSYIAVLVAAIPFAAILGWFTIQVMGELLFPDLQFVLNLVFIIPALLYGMTNVMIWISTKSSSTRDAQQLGSLFSMLFLLFLASMIVAYFAIGFSMFLVFFTVLIIIDYLLTKFGLHILNRDTWNSS